MLSGMAARKLLHESGSTLRESAGGRWALTLVTPGTGASGTYAEGMLAQYAPAAFPKGTKLWFNHPKEGEGAGQRDPRDQWGYLAADATYEWGVGAVGEAEVLPHWKEVVDSLGTQASLSIYAMGEADEDGNVTALLPDLVNSVDIVAYPGRPGSGLTAKMYESARAASTNASVVTSARNLKEGKMDEKVLEALNALIAKFDAFVTESKAAAKTDAVAEADADAIDKAVGEALGAYDEKVAAIEAAKLLPPQVESLRAEARLGKDVAPLIESAKKVMDAAKAAVVTETKTAEGFALGADGNYAVSGLVIS